MALNLIETLNKNVDQATTPSLQPGATEGAKKLLTTKATGRAIGQGTAPASSTQAEKASIKGGEAALQTQQLQQKLTGKGLEQTAQQQEQRIETEERGILQKAKAQKSQYKLQAQGLLQDFQRGVKKLDDAKDALAVEMLGHHARMTNDKYLHQLNMADKELDLNNSLSWSREQAKSVINAELEDFYDKIDFDKFMNADDRAFKKEMAQMDMATAQRLLDESVKQMNKQALYEGSGEIIKSGIQAGEKYAASSEEEPEKDNP